MPTPTRNFTADPEAFLQFWVLDNISVPRRDRNYGALVNRLNAAKKCYFQLVEVSSTFFGIGTNKVEIRFAAQATDLPTIDGDFPVAAYWCPFLSGKTNVGWVDLPRANPAHKFCLTAAMQGCSLVVTDSVPASPATFRLHHHQHPDEEYLWARMEPPTHIAAHANPPANTVLASNTVDFADYGDPIHDVPNYGFELTSNAINLAFYDHRAGYWKFLTQGHHLVPTGNTVSVVRNQNIPIRVAQVI